MRDALAARATANLQLVEQVLLQSPPVVLCDSNGLPQWAQLSGRGPGGVFFGANPNRRHGWHIDSPGGRHPLPLQISWPHAPAQGTSLRLVTVSHLSRKAGSPVPGDTGLPSLGS